MAKIFGNLLRPNNSNNNNKHRQGSNGESVERRNRARRRRRGPTPSSISPFIRRVFTVIRFEEREGRVEGN